MHRVNVERLTEIRKLIDAIEQSDEESMKIPAELFYDLENAGIIHVDQENWSYAPRYAITQKKKAERFDMMRGMLRNFFSEKAGDTNMNDYVLCYTSLGALHDITNDPEWDQVKNCKTCDQPMVFREQKANTGLQDYYAFVLVCENPNCPSIVNQEKRSA